MYFWNIKKLKANLIERPMTDKEVLPYLIAILLMFTIAEYSPKPIHYNIKDYLEICIVTIANIFGTYWLYLKNNGNTGSNFLQRYFALGWVAVIRVIVFCLPVVILFFIIGTALQVMTPDTKNTNWHDLIAIILLEIYYFWYFGKHLVDVAQKATYHKD